MKLKTGFRNYRQKRAKVTVFLLVCKISIEIFFSKLLTLIFFMTFGMSIKIFLKLLDKDESTKKEGA